MATSLASDAMISRLQTELEERNTHAQGIIRAAQDETRDLNEAEQQTLAGLRNRMGELQTQLDSLDATAQIAIQTRNRMSELDTAIRTARPILVDAWVKLVAAGMVSVDEYRAAERFTGEAPTVAAVALTGGEM